MSAKPSADAPDHSSTCQGDRAFSAKRSRARYRDDRERDVERIAHIRKKYPAERYYEPNFPVVKLQDVVLFDDICREMSGQITELFERRAGELKAAFERTTLKEHGWKFTDLGQFFFARIQRGARERLEAGGMLAARQKHRNGAEWIFWAEETAEAGPR